MIYYEAMLNVIKGNILFEFNHKPFSYSEALILIKHICTQVYTCELLEHLLSQDYLYILLVAC